MKLKKAIKDASDEDEYDEYEDEEPKPKPKKKKKKKRYKGAYNNPKSYYDMLDEAGKY